MGILKKVVGISSLLSFTYGDQFPVQLSPLARDFYECVIKAMDMERKQGIYFRTYDDLKADLFTSLYDMTNFFDTNAEDLPHGMTVYPFVRILNAISSIMISGVDDHRLASCLRNDYLKSQVVSQPLYTLSQIGLSSYPLPPISEEQKLLLEKATGSPFNDELEATVFAWDPLTIAIALNYSEVAGFFKYKNGVVKGYGNTLIQPYEKLNITYATVNGKVVALVDHYYPAFLVHLDPFSAAAFSSKTDWLEEFLAIKDVNLHSASTFTVNTLIKIGMKVEAEILMKRFTVPALSKYKKDPRTQQKVHQQLYMLLESHSKKDFIDVLKKVSSSISDSVKKTLLLYALEKGRLDIMDALNPISMSCFEPNVMVDQDRTLSLLVAAARGKIFSIVEECITKANALPDSEINTLIKELYLHLPSHLLYHFYNNNEIGPLSMLVMDCLKVHIVGNPVIDSITEDYFKDINEAADKGTKLIYYPPSPVVFTYERNIEMKEKALTMEYERLDNTEYMLFIAWASTLLALLMTLCVVLSYCTSVLINNRKLDYKLHCQSATANTINPIDSATGKQPLLVSPAE